MQAASSESHCPERFRDGDRGYRELSEAGEEPGCPAGGFGHVEDLLLVSGPHALEAARQGPTPRILSQLAL